MLDTLENFNLEEQNAEGTEGSLKEIESTVNAIVPFVLQSGDEESREPYVGMKFQSLDVEFKFYLDDAHRNGFSVHKNRITRSRKNKAMIDREFFCSKEEFRSKKSLKSDKIRDETREGCKTMCIYQRKKKKSRL
ncbi:hypothetical protein T459_02272 [Capsicum annuum]|uniref:FAR1 domain-containing protein n=1 Tax=Capsicum annuum TaxID=4072 RepID=A0A2G3AJK8_CAPAN|nr:hypothetical protein T459_02272 [Capsicum annuum]